MLTPLCLSSHHSRPLPSPPRVQVARLNEENAGLRQRLSRYEGLPHPRERQRCGGGGSRRSGDGRSRVSLSGGSRAGSVPGLERSAGGEGARVAGSRRKREGEREPAFEGRARHAGASVNCLNSRESAAFADRVQMVR